MIADQIQDTSNKVKILSKSLPSRVVFNPKNKSHRESVKQFIETGKWGEVLFVAEHPFIEVPATVLNKLAKHALGIK